MDDVLALGFVEAKQIEDMTTDDGEIGPGIFSAGVHLVVVQCHIKTPMDAILYALNERAPR